MPVRRLLPLSASTDGGPFLFATFDSDSSRSAMQRSVMRRLLKQVQKGMIHVVVVYRLEHLSAKSPRAARNHRAAVPAQGIVSLFEPAVKYE
jgi:DNA invertase Pin-like site-specific DNA recombinase